MALFDRSNINPQAEMSFLGHLEALRWHLVRAVGVVMVLALTWFFLKELLFDGILLAPKNPQFLTYRILCHLSDRLQLGEDLCIREIPFRLIATDISSQFTTHMWVAFVAGLVTGFPYVVWELWRFIKPALHEKERRYANGIVFYTSFLFITGVLFGYYIITPMTVNFLGNYQVSTEVQNMISLDSFISTVTTMTLITGIVFELPIVVYFLSKVGILSPKFMRDYRKHAIVVILILSAVITPTSDATTLIMVAIPLYILYEVSIFVSAYVVRGKQAVQ
ncbi:MAG: twin-arginine translocase subunit TatC [Bacteroidia bacterium]|jgi:sec-independent protein translocase protein TatC|nr:twin-arginine translocase subunit TatC [Bacteroidia bacterium]MBP6010154.1 twin-arginine translocase subunit TatC [Bacteroidia bacterium]MBP7270260.1 twin-arginine translocase subunit TatC [Bacteroidia bacterium]MBP7436951.1 twin-arginine translocase subunit TatC [Bacteroidia bacterium]MBP7772859.1 twin-arginine translocase subunit TatC [Bacteroidia bacterium]